MKLFKYFVKIIYRSHLLEITSIVGTSFPLMPCDYSMLFTNLLEGAFSELQRLAEARRSVTKVMSSSCSQPSPTKE